MCVLVAQSCPTICSPMDCSLPGYVKFLPMKFSRQEYWSGLSFPSPEDLPDLGIEPGSPALQADALLSELLEKPFLAISFANFFEFSAIVFSNVFSTFLCLSPLFLFGILI